MKKRLLTIALMVTALVGSSLTALAAGNATVVFTPNNELVYSNVTQQDANSVNIGDAFQGVAPGETRSATITLSNESERVIDFYMNAEVLGALEETRTSAAGAGYEIKLSVGTTVLYDSLLGGYVTTEDSGSNIGLEEFNSSFSNKEVSKDILVATLEKGETTDVVLQIKFDGEAMDNTESIDYSNTRGAFGFVFKAGYEDPSGETVIEEVEIRRGVTNYITQIIEEVVPQAEVLGAVRTGDNAMLIGGAAVLAAGVILLVVTGKKKKTEEQS